MWNPATRLSFRFAFVYFTLFVLASQVAGSLFLLPWVDFHGFGAVSPLREITAWLAGDVLAIREPLDPTGADGESWFFVVQVAWMLVLASVAAVVWSVVDRARTNYTGLHNGFRVLIRLGLASQMIEYGMTKVIPNQFAAPSLTTLVTPAGDLSLNAFFWTSVGASPAYQMLTGWAELAGGVLLLVPQTTLAGALVSLIGMAHVFALNMTYDIGLKLTSFHLVLMAAVLLAPDLGRMGDFLIGRRAAPAVPRVLFRSPWWNRIAVAGPVMVGVYLIATQAALNIGYWNALGGGAPRSALYGIWDLRALAVDGEIRPVALNDYDRRLRRVIFDTPGELTFQRIDDSLATYGASIDLANNRVVLTKGGSRNWRAEFRMDQPSEGEMVLDGAMDGYALRMELERVDLESFRLVTSPFRWIRRVGE